MGEEPWGGRSSPEMARSAGGDGGLAGSRTGSLVALGWCGVGQKEEEEEGYKMGAVVVALMVGNGRGSGGGFLRPLMTTTGGRRSADVSMTSCPFFYSFSFSFFCKWLITF